MALSESQIPPDAQHYLVCGTEDCEKSCQFYCNNCHQQMCEQCRNEHQKNKKTKNHEVVHYKQRKRQLPVEKCKIHSTKDIDLLCEECQIPLCYKCATTKEHRGHVFTDLEMVFGEKVTLCHEEIAKIRNHLEPTSQNLKKEIAADIKEIKKIMEDLRKSMKAKEQSTFALKSEDLIIRPIPETSKPVPPVFSAGQYSKEDVAKLLGKITVPNTKPENRKIKTIETASIQLKPTVKQRKTDSKQTLSLSSSVTKVREYTVPGVEGVYHVSVGKSGRLWVSDGSSNLVQTDLQGNQLQKMQTRGKLEGYHTVTQYGDLIYTDKDKYSINRTSLDNTITEFIKTGHLPPISIHSSHINGDILVGMRKKDKGKVTRYNKTGTEIQKIETDNKGHELYSEPHYITENINGDVCVSDYNKYAVVVVNKLGQHRFSYTGHGSEFYPYGICTDVLGHILVCDFRNDTVDLLDQDGQFLCLLLTKQQGVKELRSVCVDDENNLIVGKSNSNTLTVYKYLQ